MFSPVPFTNEDEVRSWRDEVKMRFPKFSTGNYVSKAQETEINRIFPKTVPDDANYIDTNKEFTDPVFLLSESYYKYSQTGRFWVNETRIPFLILDEYLETLKKLVTQGDVCVLDLANNSAAMEDHFLPPNISLCASIARKLSETADKKPVSSGSRGGKDGNSEEKREDVWSPAWIDNCSNLRLGAMIGKDVATFKLVENGSVSRKEDWEHFLAVVGPKAEMKWSNEKSCSDYEGSKSVYRKTYGVSRTDFCQKLTVLDPYLVNLKRI